MPTLIDCQKTIFFKKYLAASLQILGLLCFYISLTASEITLIPAGATWKYMDDGSDLGFTWQQENYDDSAWAMGKAQLGYGENDEQTEVNINGVTTYFRHKFIVHSTDNLENLMLEVLRDDGVIVYINDVEAWRSNMPSGTVNYQTLAPGNTVGDDEDTFFVTTLPVSLIQEGMNYIAVELHQRESVPADASFDLRLKGVVNDEIIPLGADWKYLDDGSNQGTLWQQPTFDDSAWASGPAELGYGDGDEATVVDYGSLLNKHITTYFRKTVNIPDLSLILAFNLHLLRDDGAVVYVNGTEVYRTNLPAGVIGYQTLAPFNITGDAEQALNYAVLPTNHFIEGDNVIAVELHQRGALSSDLSFDMKLIASIQPEVVRGPYLQTGTPNSMVVRWRTVQAGPSKVWYGTHPDSLNQSVSSTALLLEHELNITGLAPSTTYYYAIGVADIILKGGTSDYFFTTSPPHGTTPPTRVWVLGDSGTGNDNARAVRDAYYNYIGSDPTDAIIMLGDNAYDDGTDEEYQVAVFENMYEDLLRNIPLWPCPGNHDYYSGADAATQSGTYYDIFTLPRNGEAGGLASGTEAYYSFDIGNIHFISLDSHDTDRSVGGGMLTWLENDLAATTQEWIIAYWHHPPYTRGSHNSDIEPRLIEMRNNALPILEAYGVDLVMCGHSHSYERSYLLNGHYSFSITLQPEMIIDGGSGKLDVDCLYQRATEGPDKDLGAVYVVAGSSGKISGGSLNHPVMFTSMNDLGSVVLEVEGQVLNAKFVNDNGLVNDYFTILKRFITVQTDTAANIVADTLTLIPGDTIHLNTMEGFATYQWAQNGTPIGGNTPDLIVTEGGEYTVLALQAGGCAIFDTLTILAAPQVPVRANVLLQAPYDVTTGFMSTDLRTADLLPLQQPFNRPPWNYAGTESVTQASDFPSTMTDWALLEVRDPLDNHQIIEQKAAFLLQDGTLLDTAWVHDHSLDAVHFYQIAPSADYFLSVKTRNHLAVLSADAVTLPNATSYDFTLPAQVSGGMAQLADLGNGIYGLLSGDFNADGIITIADFNVYSTQASLLNIYVPGDLNMDKTVSVVDYNWYQPNASKIGVSQIRY